MLFELLEPLFELACYATGYPVVRILSLGYLHVGESNPDKRKRRWYSVSLTFTHRGKRYADPDLVTLVGVLTWLLIGILTTAAMSG